MVHEADSLTDLPDEHHAVHLRQLVVVVDDPLEELTTLHTAWGWTMGSLQGGSLPQAILLQSSLPSWAPWPSSTMEMLSRARVGCSMLGLDSPKVGTGTHNSMKRMISRGVSMAS